MEATVARAQQLGLTVFCVAFLAAGLQLCDEEVGPDAYIEDLDHTALKKAIDECQHFVHSQAALLGDADREQAGTDFWLTRNGHGAGYWDRPEVYGEEAAQLLSDACGEYGPCDLYRGDNRRIYFYPSDTRGIST